MRRKGPMLLNSWRQWWNRQAKRSPRPCQRDRRKANRTSRLLLELLEDRTLLSTIVWVNRGGDLDGFDQVFGNQANIARADVDAALQAWQNVITNFNYSDGSNEFDMFLSMGDNG